MINNKDKCSSSYKDTMGFAVKGKHLVKMKNKKNR